MDDIVLCARCGEVATEYDETAGTFYCRSCALEIARERISDDDLLEMARFGRA